MASRASNLVFVLSLLANFVGTNSAVAQSVPASQVLAGVTVSNLDSSEFPWRRCVSNTECEPGFADGQVKRWDIETDGPIPVQLNGVAFAEQAIDAVEARLGYTVFDRVSIAGVDPMSVTRGLIVSEGTAIGSGGVVTVNTCGGVSEGIGTTSYPNDFLESSGEISTRLYVHIASTLCAPRLDIATHEFGHALGLGPHFSDFGIDSVIGEVFWFMLATLYDNPIGTEANAIVVPSNTDIDDDNDGVPDHTDAFPLDAEESIDTDDDGIGNNTDTDDDNDGMPDQFETTNGLDPLDSADALADSDSDGLTNLEEFSSGRNPQLNETAPLLILFELLLSEDMVE